ETKTPPFPRPARTRLPSRSSKQAAAEWAEIGPFESAKEAETFWNTASMDHLSLVSGLRFKMISPFDKRYKQPEGMTVRVGPLKSQKHFEEICHLADDFHKKCGVVNESGYSISQRTTRYA